jgi:hypothetical protein
MPNGGSLIRRNLIMFSRPLLGTDKKKTKLSWFEYIWHSCILQGWYNCWYAFKNWGDLMGDNYQEYALLISDDPLEQCALYFWDSLEDDIYPKEFLESLMQMADDVETGKVETVPFTKEMFDKLEDLVGDIEVNFDEKLEE